MKFLIFSLFLMFGCENEINAKNVSDFKLTAINSEEALAHIKKNKVTFLEVGSKSCYSCQVVGKNIESVKNKNQNFNVIFVDVFKDGTALKKFKVEAIPTQIILSDDGKEHFRHVGILDKNQIEDLVNKYQVFESK